MDGKTSIPQEFSRVLVDLVIYYIAVSGVNEAGIRQRTGLARWEDLSDDKLLLMVGTVARTAQRRTPDRTRIMRMATIRYLAGSDAADYGDRLFALSDEQLQGIHDRLLLTSASEKQYAEWRASRAGRQVWALVEELTFEAVRDGRDSWGMKAVFEKGRWRAHAGSAADLNNNYTAALGRDMRAAHPDLPRDFFKPRESIANNWTRITS
jgi:hypothetical protein